MVKEKQLALYEKYDAVKKGIIDSALQKVILHLNVRVGDFIIDNGSVLRIADIVFKKDRNNSGDEEEEIIIELDHLYEGDDEEREWSHYGSYSIEELARTIERNGIISKETGYEKYLEDCQNFEPFASEEERNDQESTALVKLDKQLLLSEARRMDIYCNEVRSMQSALKMKLEMKRRRLENIVEKLEARMSKIQKVLYSIELYLGIKENIISLQEGSPAAEGTPLCFRQRILYMDVECGDPCYTGKGITFETLDKFNEWLLAVNPYYRKKNYEISVPEEKCVVVFRVRQRDREHYENEHPVTKAGMNAEDSKTYILLRNGQNLSFIWSDIRISPRLFPRPDEFVKEENDHWYDEGKHDKINQHYKMQALMLQGLMDRTDIFKPLKSGINIFNPATYTDSDIRFIYDDGKNLLEDSVVTFEKLWKSMNEQIAEGSRVYVFKAPRDRRDTTKRLYLNFYRSEWSVPDSPGSGIYQVYEDKEHTCGYSVKRNVLKIMYNPGGEIYSRENREYTERKRKLSYMIFPSDDFLINWDTIKEEHIPVFEKMMYDRRNRYNNKYLWTLPFLHQLVEEKRAEIESERNFVLLAMAQTGKSEAEVKDAVDWWKIKNKWKRFLSADDSKALRMIVKKLKGRSR